MQRYKYTPLALAAILALIPFALREQFIQIWGGWYGSLMACLFWLTALVLVLYARTGTLAKQPLYDEIMKQSFFLMLITGACTSAFGRDPSPPIYPYLLLVVVIACAVNVVRIYRS